MLLGTMASNTQSNRDENKLKLIFRHIKNQSNEK